jgi:FkbM family methyltransferase
VPSRTIKTPRRSWPVALESFRSHCPSPLSEGDRGCKDTDFMRFATRTAEKLQQLMAQSRLATATAVKMGNFARQVVVHRVQTTIHLKENGEGRLLDHLGPTIRRFIDVGANVGDWTAAVLATAPRASGILVEPSSNAFATLQQRYSGDGRTTLVCAAAGPSNGEGEFFEEPNAGNTSSLIRAATHGTVEPHRVPIRSVDSLIAEFSWPDADMLKVDCEGYDYFVLQGASSAFRAQRIGLVQFEYNTSWRDGGARLHEAHQLMSQAGYFVFFLRPDGLYRGWEKFGEFYQYSNFVAVSSRRMSQLTTLVRGQI